MRSRRTLWSPRNVVMISAVIAAATVAASSAKLAGAPATSRAADVPTYSKDVAPIVQKNCQVCHRPGEAGPFSLLTYEEARRRAGKIKDALVDGKMPPWFADPHYGKFSNAMGVSTSAIETARSHHRIASALRSASIASCPMFAKASASSAVSGNGSSTTTAKAPVSSASCRSPFR